MILQPCTVRDATHVKLADGRVEKIASTWGIKPDGGFEKGGFGVVTESGERVGMLDAHSYYRAAEVIVIGPDVKTKRRACLNCSRDLSGAFAFGQGVHRHPREGSACICSYCAHVMIVGADDKFRQPTQDELEIIENDTPTRLAVAAVRMKIGRKPS